MKVKLYFGNEEAIKKSGIGRAMVHQKKALSLHNIPYVKDKKDMNYDILHINTTLPDSYMELKRAKKQNKKIIYHAHSTEEDFRNSFMFSNLVSGMYKKWLIYLYSKADYILTPTPYSKKLLEGYGIKIPIQNISNGINLEEFNPTTEQKDIFVKSFGIQEKDILVISVGWLFERKGFDTFVEVARKLPNYKFMWFGDIKLSNPTTKIRKLLHNLPNNILLPGYINSNVLKGAYGRSNIFFFPSREETEGIVVLEALASKCQVVLRDIPVFEDWIIDTEHCYKGNTEDEFVSIITKLVNETLPSTREGGFEVAKQREISLIGEELKNVYKRVNK